MPNARLKRGVIHGSAAKTAIDISKYQGVPSERRKDESEREHREKVVDEACREHGLAVFGAVEPVFDHHGVDDRDRGGGKRDAGEPARPRLPAEDEERGGGAP